MKKRRQFYSAHPKALKCKSSHSDCPSGSTSSISRFYPDLKKRHMYDKEAVGELNEAEAVLAADYQTDISLSIEYSDT